MRHKRLKLCAVFLLGLGLTGLQAQENINATGGDASGSGGSASYSVGQIAYTTNSGSTGSVAQGVQHAFEIYSLGIEDIKGINISIAAYPNPTADYLTLDIKDLDLSSVTFQLFDIHGRLLQNQKITENYTRIVTGNLPVATYFVKVRKGEKELKSFKIIKN